VCVKRNLDKITLRAAIYAVLEPKLDYSSEAGGDKDECLLGLDWIKLGIKLQIIFHLCTLWALESGILSLVPFLLLEKG